MSEQRVSRRNFIQTTTMTAVGAALGMNTLAAAAEPAEDSELQREHGIPPAWWNGPDDFGNQYRRALETDPVPSRFTGVQEEPAGCNERLSRGTASTMSMPVALRRWRPMPKR